MKINKINHLNYKLIKFKLITTKIYKPNYTTNTTIENIAYNLKKALNVIYNYHVNNKKILFVGSPMVFQPKLIKLLKKTKHQFIPEAVWKSGFLTNRQAYLNDSFRNKISIDKRNDLIVIFNSQTTVTQEAYLTRVPTISINLELSNTVSDYKIPGNFKFIAKKTRNNFCYSLLNSIFIKEKYIKNVK